MSAGVDLRDSIGTIGVSAGINMCAYVSDLNFLSRTGA